MDRDIKQKIFKTYEIPDPIRIKKVVKFIWKYFGEVKGLNILDCGISKGGVADILSGEGANCFGVDINPRKIKDINIIQGDLNKGIPEFGIKFDVIFAGEIIEHLFNDTQFIQECKKILRPKGLLIITTPNLASLPNRIKLLFGRMPDEAYAAASFHHHLYNRKKLNDLVKKEGFEILKSTSSYLLPGSLSEKPLYRYISSFLGDIFPSFGIQLIIFTRKI